MIFIWWKLKIVTLLPILIGILQLLFAICFCIPTYLHQQLLSLDCQNFVHHNSLVFFTYLGNAPGVRFHFWKGTYTFQNCFRTLLVYVWVHQSALKNVSSLLPPYTFSLSLSPIQNLKEALNMPPGMSSTIHLLEIIRLSAFKSPLFYPSS